MNPLLLSLGLAAGNRALDWLVQSRPTKRTKRAKSAKRKARAVKSARRRSRK